MAEGAYVQAYQERKQTQNRLRIRADKVFHSCPNCLSPNVLKLDGEVLCTYCEWDTVGLQASLQNPTHIFHTRGEV